ncbi:MAG: M1 family metallopeptidase [Bacteroidota bacterium]
MPRYVFALILLSISLSASAQHTLFNRQDSLRGTITPERAWWDLTYYDLDIAVFPDEKRITGRNLIQYEVLRPAEVLQIDLQPPLQLRSALQDGEALEIVKEGNAHFIHLKKPQEVGAIEKVIVTYGGQPREAVRAPWDGGFSWKKDQDGQHFVATSCQGLGASVWWPCKDHMYDEVDSMRISVEIPTELIAVCNGRLEGVSQALGGRDSHTYHWKIDNPINNYGVNVNIGNYVGWEEVYAGEKGPLDVFYWALKQDEERARQQFQEVPRMLEAFEHWFGPYPFYEDGYKLVQVPYLGMEHQSSVTYGNDFQQGYLGSDLSRTGWGLKFDFIIVHESGHEWFANNLTHKDMADMWLHEGFTNYSESLFVEYFFGTEAGREYARGTRGLILNDRPLIGDYDVNDQHYTSDVYYKGGNLLNTLRSVVQDDEKWRGVLRSLGETFYHQTTNTAAVEAHMADFLDFDLGPFFDQYLRDTRIPTFEYYFLNEVLYFRWSNAIASFNMPVDVTIGSAAFRLYPSTEWQRRSQAEAPLSVDPNYYIALFKSR